VARDYSLRTGSPAIDQGVLTRVAVYNARGAVIAGRSSRGGPIAVETAAFPAGIYAVRMSAGDATQVWKVLMGK
jgi:hypothetical protein